MHTVACVHSFILAKHHLRTHTHTHTYPECRQQHHIRKKSSRYVYISIHTLYQFLAPTLCSRWLLFYISFISHTVFEFVSHMRVCLFTAAIVAAAAVVFIKSTNEYRCVQFNNMPPSRSFLILLENNLVAFAITFN